MAILHTRRACRARWTVLRHPTIRLVPSSTEQRFFHKHIDQETEATTWLAKRGRDPTLHVKQYRRDEAA